MKTRCKFLCVSITKQKNYRCSTENPFTYSAKFQAVTEGSEENKRFFSFTPSGTLELSLYRDDLFQPGKEYMIDLEQAP